MKVLETLSELIEEYDADLDGFVSLAEFTRATQDARFQNILCQISLPVGFTVDELFAVLVSDVSGLICNHEFTGGLFRMMFSTEFQRECLMRLEHTYVKRCVLNVRDQVIAEVRHDNRKVIKEIQSLRAEIGNRSQTANAAAAAEVVGDPADAANSSVSASFSGGTVTGSMKEDVVGPPYGHKNCHQMSTLDSRETTCSDFADAPSTLYVACTAVETSHALLQTQIANLQGMTDPTASTGCLARDMTGQDRLYQRQDRAGTNGEGFPMESDHQRQAKAPRDGTIDELHVHMYVHASDCTPRKETAGHTNSARLISQCTRAL